MVRGCSINVLNQNKTDLLFFLVLVSTRNRFSNWAPPNKKKDGKGKGKGKGKGEGGGKGGGKGGGSGRAAPASLVKKMEASADAKRNADSGVLLVATKSPTSFSNTLLAGVELGGLDEVYMSPTQIDNITELLALVDRDNKARETTGATSDDLGEAKYSDSKEVENVKEDGVTGDNDDSVVEEDEETLLAKYKNSSVLEYLTRTLSFSVSKSLWALKETEGRGSGDDGVSTVLDYLCLHLANDELEKAFQVRNEHPAQALRLRTDVKGSVTSAKGTVELVAKRDFTVERNQIGLERLGFSKMEASRIMIDLSVTQPTRVIENDALMLGALMNARPRDQRKFTTAQTTEAQLLQAEEISVLASIFGACHFDAISSKLFKSCLYCYFLCL
jgi:hypothetical protein